MDIVTLALAKKFTKDTVIGLGAIKGSPCTIKSIVHANGVNTVTFEWEGFDGTIRTTDMTVEDGTPIYVWTAGDSYDFGDLVIYNATFYRCIAANVDMEWDETHWNAIGTADGNFSITDTYAHLPVRFTPADRKIYYVADESMFYYWNGTRWEAQARSITNSEVDQLFS